MTMTITLGVTQRQWGEKKKKTGGKSPRKISREAHADAQTFPIFIQFLCNNSNNNNQHNNSKKLTVAGRNAADISVFPPGKGVFFCEKRSTRG